MRDDGPSDLVGPIAKKTDEAIIDRINLPLDRGFFAQTICIYAQTDNVTDEAKSFENVKPVRKPVRKPVKFVSSILSARDRKSKELKKVKAELEEANIKLQVANKKLQEVETQLDREKVKVKIVKEMRTQFDKERREEREKVKEEREKEREKVREEREKEREIVREEREKAKKIVEALEEKLASLQRVSIAEGSVVSENTGEITLHHPEIGKLLVSELATKPLQI